MPTASQSFGPQTARDDMKKVLLMRFQLDAVSREETGLRERMQWRYEQEREKQEVQHLMLQRDMAIMSAMMLSQM